MLLELNTVEVKYAEVILVLKGVSLEVPEASIVALLGANGAGKTTTLKAISGLLKAEEGQVTRGYINFGGERIDTMNPADIVKRGIVQCMEGRRVFEHLTVEENLRAGAHTLVGNRGYLSQRLGLIYDYFPRLRDLRNNTSGYLSGGEQQMLVIGRALMTHPKLMLLDEPSLGLSPLLVKEIFGILWNIWQTEKTSILLVEQNVRVALSIASHGYVMENGKIVIDASVEKLLNNADVKEFYLGLSEVGTRKHFTEAKHYARRKRWLT
jgi:branched-chain amino acid transport system ATP-binding protein